MSKITLTPHASGSGTLNIAAPNTNSTRTLTLPDADLNLGNVLTTSSSVDAANLTGALPAIDGSALTNLPIPASAVTLISTFTISTAVASVDFTLPTSGYTTLSVLATGLVGDTNGDSLYGRTSSNGGATFDAGATDYSFAGNQVSAMRFNSNDMYTNAGASSSYTITIQNRSGLYNYFYGRYAYWRSSAIDGIGGGVLSANARNSTVQVNVFRLFPVSGNLTAGTFNLYGWT